MPPRPSIDYETPEPRRRVGVLARLNPKATPWSVVRHACLAVLVAAALWGLCLIYRPNPRWQPSWPFFILWLCCAAFCGAVCEWQVRDDDDEPREPE